MKSPRARNKIRQWFTKERREEAIEDGKDQIAKLMRKEGLPLQRLLSHETLTLVAVHFKLADVSALYAAVGEGNLSAQAVVRRVIDLHGGNEGAVEDLSEAVTITGRGRSRRPVRRRHRRDRQGRARRVGQAREVLHAGAARRHPRVRHQGRRGVGAPQGLHQRRQPDGPARAAAGGRVGAHRPVDVPGQHPGRGARPGPAAVRHHDGALRRAREHPQREPVHHPRPGRQEPVHVRDGRVEAPRQRAARGPRRSPASSTPTA